MNFFKDFLLKHKWYFIAPLIIAGVIVIFLLFAAPESSVAPFTYSIF